MFHHLHLLAALTHLKTVVGRFLSNLLRYSWRTAPCIDSWPHTFPGTLFHCVSHRLTIFPPKHSLLFFFSSIKIVTSLHVN